MCRTGTKTRIVQIYFLELEMEVLYKSQELSNTSWCMQTFIAQFNNFVVFNFVVSAKDVLGYINAKTNLPLK